MPNSHILRTAVLIVIAFGVALLLQALAHWDPMTVLTIEAVLLGAYAAGR